jgi:hypothetical protein
MFTEALSPLEQSKRTESGSCLVMVCRPAAGRFGRVFPTLPDELWSEGEGAASGGFEPDRDDASGSTLLREEVANCQTNCHKIAQARDIFVEAPGIELAEKSMENTWSFASFARLAGSSRPSIAYQ